MQVASTSECKKEDSSLTNQTILGQTLILQVRCCHAINCMNYEF